MEANQSKLVPPADPEVVAGCLRGWVAGEGTLAARLAAALASAIERGDLLPGTRLPPDRSLARTLAVGRSTVVAAYGLLARQGVVSRRQGSGTWVEPARDNPEAHSPEFAGRPRHKLFAVSSFDERRGAINLLAATPAAIPAVRELAAQAALEIDETGDHHGYWPFGFPPLRREVARRLTRRGLKTTEAEVLVTTGAQQAIALAAAAFVRAGELVLLEDPTYPGAVDAFRQVGARILTAPVRGSGIDLGVAADLLGRADVKLVYATPSFQNPTGVAMPVSERARLGQLAVEHGAVLVEDEVQAELPHGGAAPPPVAAFGAGARIITIGSLSKLFWGGLRVGWIRAPQPLLSHIGRLKAVLDLGSPLPSQAVATHVLRRADEIAQIRIEEIRARAEALGELLEADLPGWTWSEPAGGLVLWVRLPHGSATELAEVARGKGVMILPGTMTSPSGSCDDHVRVPFVAPPEVLAEGVRRLARAWSTYAGPASRAVNVVG